jgi:2-oxoglutarate ferredoxin oxidoreductase subunit beta
MNNGVYGLTKGQFSATADQGSRSKRGVVNNDTPVDLAALALQLGVSFVARSFSGNKEQLTPLIEAALMHQGAAFIDVISPCVAFNNHPGSTKSYDYVREHNESVNRVDFVPHAEEITAYFEPGTVQDVLQHDGSVLRLRTLNAEFDVHDRIAAMNYLHQRQAEGEVVTGLLHIDPEPHDLHRHLNTSMRPLNVLDEKVLCPGASALERINASLR